MEKNRMKELGREIEINRNRKGERKRERDRDIEVYSEIEGKT
jgi:hypothetical protein